MDEVSVAVLEHCLQPNPLIGLRDRFPMATVYRRVRKLVAGGSLVKDGDLYRTTDRGREEIRFPAFRSPLEQVLPQLVHMPTAIHRALVELIAAAVVIRQHGPQDDHHAAFVVVGPTLKWKTWTAKMVCAMFGLDPVDHVLLASSESGRSLLTRRGYGGSTVSKRGILSSPFIAVDEYHKADDRQRRMAAVYLQGTRVVAYENDRLEIRPVPLFIMNPLKGNTLQTKTGLDDPQIRRCIVADLDGVTIPEAFRSRGDELIANAMKIDPIKLAGRQPVDCSTFRDALAETLRRCVTPEALQRIDEELVLQLANGMSAFVPPEEAWIIVVRDLFVVWDTLGWMAPGWRLQMPDAAMPVQHGKPKDPEPLSLSEETRKVVAEAHGATPRDLGMAKRVASAQAKLKAARDATKREQQAMERLYVQTKTTQELLRQFVSVRDYLTGAGLSWDAPALLWAAQVVAADRQNAGAVVDLARGLVARGIRGVKADTLVQNLPAGMTWDQAMNWLEELRRRHGNAEKAVAAEEAEATKAKQGAERMKVLASQFLDEANDAIRERNANRAEAAVAEKQRSAKWEECRQLDAEKARLEEACASLSKGHERTKAVAAHAADELQTTERELREQKHLAAVYAALEAGVSGDPDPARELMRWLGTDGGEDPVRALRKLVADALADLVVPRDAVDVERRAWEEREARLLGKVAAAEERAGALEKELDREREARTFAQAEIAVRDQELAESGRKAETLAEGRQKLEAQLAETERGWEAERTAKRDAEAKARAIEEGLVAAKNEVAATKDEVTAAKAETKKAGSDLLKAKERVAAAERVLALAPDGRPIPLADLNRRIEAHLASVIEWRVAQQVDRRTAKALAAGGLVALRPVRLPKACPQGHPDAAVLSPPEIEALRTGDLPAKLFAIRRTPGTGSIGCHTCGVRVDVTIGEVLDQLAVAP